jgi:hypothetical protein
MEHLITANEVVSAGRPMGGKVDEGRLTSYIAEIEQLNIKPVLGDALFLDLLQNGDTNEKYKLLLSGGTYTSSDGSIYSFAGLKACIAYYVFAKNVMVGDFQTTRYGVVLKESDYASHISSKERSDCYNDTLEVANCYLKDCVRYCRHVGIISSASGFPKATGGIRIRKIGK